MCAKKNDEIIKLDETDIKILKIINDDVRISYRQISRDLGISVGTVHNRIDKMLKSGVIEKFKLGKQKSQTIKMLLASMTLPANMMLL